MYIPFEKVIIGSKIGYIVCQLFITPDLHNIGSATDKFRRQKTLLYLYPILWNNVMAYMVRGKDYKSSQKPMRNGLNLNG